MTSQAPLFISPDSPPYLHDALFALWRAEFLSYNLEPYMRAPVEAKLAAWIKEVETPAERGKELSKPAEIKQIQKEVEDEIQLSNFYMPQNDSMTIKTKMRLEQVLFSTNSVFNHFVKKHKGLTSEPFFEKRMDSWKKIEEKYSKNPYRSMDLKQVALYCGWLAQLKVDTHYIASEELKLDSYQGEFEAHSMWIWDKHYLIIEVTQHVRHFDGGVNMLRYYTGKYEAIDNKRIDKRKQVRRRDGTADKDDTAEMAKFVQEMQDLYHQLLKDPVVIRSGRVQEKRNIGVNPVWTNSRHPVLSHRRAAIYHL